ncbi:MAG: hypothetical protein B5766_08275 [Candidatus Lumbricidophila eiseniae]|uniref:Uncharacterized protein n=1 Tax=Candidatus Lumbricidiphila eiseniae TaxID=1969409 RepID=A0A2A6FQV9_9MICO|nr:MAG: hypothetical protein B5766_08275 [Candidatus Lumbricidophila eiseniae]
MNTESSTEATAISVLTQQALTPWSVTAGTIYTALSNRGGIEAIDTEKFLSHPCCAKGTVTVANAASFVAYVNRHVLPGTEVYAHTSTSKVVAIINGHGGSGSKAGWSDHRLELILEHTKPWLEWHTIDGIWLKQIEFAEFIEARTLDVIEPGHARLIEIATTFEAKKNADFTSAVRLDSGAVQFGYNEIVAAKVGQKAASKFRSEYSLRYVPASVARYARYGHNSDIVYLAMVHA